MKLILQLPTKFFKINQKFGENANSFYIEQGLKGHNGLDLYAPDSTPIYASHNGRVTFTGYDGGGGLGIVIRTEEKFDYLESTSLFKTLYWHLKRDTIKVTGGQTVKCGDLIALANNTGNSTGSHLHFGLKPIYKGEEDWQYYNLENENGYRGSIDPLPYLDLTTGFITLRKGDKGAKVQEMQIKLNILLPATLNTDGNFGDKTLKVLKEFQQRSGLKADGICGKLTWGKLNLVL